MAAYGGAVYLAALAGAVVGGLVTYYTSWRWVFYLNLPVGLAVFAAGRRLLAPDRLLTPGPVPFDFVGLFFFLATVVSLVVVLDMGQYWGWATSPFFVPWLAALVLSGSAFVLWGVLAREPVINLRVCGVRNCGLGLAIKALFTVNLYALVAALSAYMIELRGYQWWQGALVVLPALAGLAATMLLGVRFGGAGGRKARMLAGFAVMAAATWWISSVDLYTDKRWLAAALGVWGAGAGLVVVPALLTIFEGLTPEETAHAAGLYNCTRLLPAVAVVTVLMLTLLQQRADTYFDTLRKDITYNRPVVSQTTRHVTRHFADRGGSAATSRKQAHALLSRWVHANARAYAFGAILKVLTIAPVLGAALVLFVRRAPVGISPGPDPLRRV
jgi:DHA2 family multidrug resistance protein